MSETVMVALTTLALGLAASIVLGRVGSKLVARVSTPERSTLVGRIGLWGGATLSVLSAVNTLGVDLSVFLGAAGLFTVAFGFAAQTSASNFISGLFLVGERPFSVGEFVRIGTTEGEVLAVDFLSVKLRTPENLYVRVPNETAMKAEIVNFTRHPIRRMQLIVRVPFGTDLDQATELLLQVADDHPKVLDEPRPSVFFLRYAESAVELRLNAWTPSVGYFDVSREVGFGVHDMLRQAGIEIPVPQLRIAREPGSG